MLLRFRVRRREAQMTAGRTYIFAGLVMAAFFCCTGSACSADLTVDEYRAQLDRLLVASQQLDSSGRAIPAVLNELPQSWRLHTEHQDFEISTEGLRRDVRSFELQKNLASAIAVRSRIQGLRADLDGFEASPPDFSSQRTRLTSLLARPEFSGVHGPSSLDRLKQRLLAFVLRALGLLFGSSAIPTISKFFIYGLIGLAVSTLGFVAYRQITSATEREAVVPADFAVSKRSWALWLAEAREAAAKSNWREAIHLAYWAGISFLEQQGTWRPDRARTPREYLRLLSNPSEHGETLAALTRVFELAWYAKREASADAFAQTLQALEKLGCR